MVAAHRFLGGTGPGRRTTTQAANWSLTLILAAEFQGFTRELHDEASDAIAAAIANGNLVHFTLVRNNFTFGRDLDRWNAKPDSLKKDFARLGVVNLWTQVSSRVHSGSGWKSSLEDLNEARNGIAHNDLGKIAGLAARGMPLTLQTIRKWRAACNGVARHLDAIVNDAVYRNVGSRPW
jgi:hypothetical protein